MQSYPYLHGQQKVFELYLAAKGLKVRIFSQNFMHSNIVKNVDFPKNIILNFRKQLKGMCNKRFGSMFRTHHNPTYFSRRLARFADIYMSRPTNLLQFSVDHTFYPRRMALPHEPLPFGDYSHRDCSNVYQWLSYDLYWFYMILRFSILTF